MPTIMLSTMQSGEVVDPGDAALQALLALTAECTRDAERRDRLLGFAITVPPLVEWQADRLEVLRGTCEYIISLARLGRELRQLTEVDGE